MAQENPNQPQGNNLFADFINIENAEERAFYDQFSIYASGSTPIVLLQKIAANPPDRDIVIPFTEMCVIASGTQRSTVQEFRQKARPMEWFNALENYIMNNFVLRAMVNFSALNLIGSLILCSLPNRASSFARSFRAKLGGPSIFDVNLNNAQISVMQRQIMTQTVEAVNAGHARVVGFALCAIINAIANNRAIPDVSFITNATVALTDAERNALTANVPVSVANKGNLNLH